VPRALRWLRRAHTADLPPRRRLSVGAVLDLSERFWRGEVRGRGARAASGAVEEIAPDVLFVHAFANVTALRTAAVSFSSTRATTARATRRRCRTRLGRPARATAVYTHGHVDHACGLRRFWRRRSATAGRARASSAIATSRGAFDRIARRPRGTG